MITSRPRGRNGLSGHELAGGTECGALIVAGVASAEGLQSPQPLFSEAVQRVVRYAMGQGTTDLIRFPEASSEDVRTGILREGAQKVLADAIEAEVAAYLAARQHLRDERGHRLVVRDGHKAERSDPCAD